MAIPDDVIPRTAPSRAQTSPGLRLVAATCAVMVWLLGVLAASPDLHEWIHPDANQPGHTCAVTLFSQGLENPAVAAALVIVPVLFAVAAAVPRAQPCVETVRDWLLPGRGPPLR